MACTLLDQLGEHGEDLLAHDAAPSEAELSVSGRGKKPKAAKDTKPRAKKGEVTMLSTSFTCWRKVPEPRLVKSLVMKQIVVTSSN